MRAGIKEAMQWIEIDKESQPPSFVVCRKAKEKHKKQELTFFSFFNVLRKLTSSWVLTTTTLFPCPALRHWI